MHSIKSILTWAGAAFSALLVSCSSSSQLTQTAVPSSSERVIAERVFKLVNDERSKMGEKSLRGSRQLNAMAQGHSEFQAQSALTGGKSSDFGSQNRSQYAYLKYGIENLSEVYATVSASASDPAATAVRAWMSKAEHRRHFKQQWELTGVGVHRSNGKYYISMMTGIRPGGVPRSMRPGSIYH